MSMLQVLFEYTRLWWFIVKSLFWSCSKWLLSARYKCLRNDLVLITGGGKGIGRKVTLEIARHFPKTIILWGRNLDSLRNTASAVNNLGVHCVIMQCDVSNKLEVYTKAEEIKNTIGNVTMLINNAGVVFGQDVCASHCYEIEKTIQVNSLGQFWTVKSFLPEMIATNHGHIISINSVLGLMGLPGTADYSASKFAATGFLEALRLEVKDMDKSGVFFTSVHPFLVNTDMFKGCTTRFPFLFPPLDQHYVANKVVDAILTNQQVLIMPRLMYFVIFLKSILPVAAIVAAQKFTGVDEAMATFHGRTKKSHIHKSEIIGNLITS